MVGILISGRTGVGGQEGRADKGGMNGRLSGKESLEGQLDAVSFLATGNLRGFGMEQEA